METLPFGNMTAIVDRGHSVAGYGSCGRLGAQGINPVPRRGAIGKEKAVKSLDTERAVDAVQVRARRKQPKVASLLRTPTKEPGIVSYRAPLERSS